MARTTPVVRGDTLNWRDGDKDRSITVGTSAWFSWLEHATTFSFAGARGNFTACKERFQRGGWYWRAYRRHSGKVRRAYLGKTEALNLERLNDVAGDLAGSNPPGDPLIQHGMANIHSGDSSAERSSPHNVKRNPLLKTKLAPPPVRANLLARPNLQKRLAEVLLHRLTLVSAPAGFGKTTLLSQWVGTCGRPVAWFSLDAGDNDPARFWAYFMAALRTIHPRFGDHVLRLFRSSPNTTTESLLTMLINALTGVTDDLIIILDDYEIVESRIIHDALSVLLDQLPQQVHLIIASRADPPLPLARLRARGQLLEFRTADLSFTADETVAFLSEVMHLRLSSEDVLTLEKCTEGWIAGIQLAGLSLQRCDDPGHFVKVFSGDHRFILDYLVEEVLRRQSPDVRNFLLQTSVLERLSGPLCEAVTGQAQCQAMLETLDRANLFAVPLDNERRWYRYHQLFAGALRVLLMEQRPGDLPDLHHRAGAWFEKEGLTSEAVGHALAATEFEWAARLIEQAATPMLTQSEVTTFLSWINSLPGDLVELRPRLCLAHAWALSNAGQLEAAEARLKNVEQRLRKRANNAPGGRQGGLEGAVAGTQILLDEIVAIRTNIAIVRGDDALGVASSHQALGRLGEYDPFLRGAMTQIRASAYWLSGDFEKAESMLSEAIALNQASGDVPDAVIALSRLARVQVLKGQLHEAAKTYRQALLLAADQGPGPNPLVRMPNVGLGWLLYEWNDLNEATRCVTEGIALAKRAGVTSVVLLGYMVLARVQQAQGNLGAAFDVIQQAELLARANGLPNTVAQLASHRARLWLAQGDVRAAVRWAQSSGLQLDDELSYRHEAMHRMLARVTMAQGRLSEAVGLLERLLHAAEMAGRTGSEIKVLVLLAVALRTQGRTDEALTAAGRALSLAEPEGYVRTFLDAGPVMADLLAELLVRQGPGVHLLSGASWTYIRSLLAAFSLEEKQPVLIETEADPAKPTGRLLSGRELEVLELIAAGKTTPEIARQFVVSVTTIKTHLNNIFRKLNVHNRLKAITRARELRLLD